MSVVRTVLGEIPAVELGVTLVHEHLHMDASGLVAAHGYNSDGVTDSFDAATSAECRWNPGAHPDNYRMTEHDAILEDLRDYGLLGGRAVVDATPVDLGRDPQALVRLARDSDLYVVMGTGYYLEATHRQHLTPGSEEQAVFDLIVREHEHGIDGVRPGIIGEIGTSDPPTESELRVVRGAARAAAVSGLALCVHVHPWGEHGTSVVDITDDVGLRPNRLILNHMSTAVDRPLYLRTLLARGVFLSFDLFGFDHSLLGPGRYPPSDADAARCVAGLVAQGFVDQLLISQDVGVRTRLRCHGGWGYGHLLRHIVPLLTSYDVSPAQVEQLLVTNPANVLTLSGDLS